MNIFTIDEGCVIMNTSNNKTIFDTSGNRRDIHQNPKILTNTDNVLR